MSRATADDQLRFLLSCVKHSNSGKIDFVEVARECGIVSKGAAAKRYERLMKTNGIHPVCDNSKSVFSVKEKSKAAIAKAAVAKRRKIEGEHFDTKEDDIGDMYPYIPKSETADEPHVKTELDMPCYFSPYQQTGMIPASPYYQHISGTTGNLMNYSQTQSPYSTSFQNTTPRLVHDQSYLPDIIYSTQRPNTAVAPPFTTTSLHRYNESYENGTMSGHSRGPSNVLRSTIYAENGIALQNAQSEQEDRYRTSLSSNHDQALQRAPARIDLTNTSMPEENESALLDTVHHHSHGQLSSQRADDSRKASEAIRAEQQMHKSTDDTIPVSDLKSESPASMGSTEMRKYIVIVD